jgi:phenylacetate-CoA ligase
MSDPHPSEPWRSSIAYWDWFSRVSEIWWARSQGEAWINSAQSTRFMALAQFARQHSRFYQQAYHNVPGHIVSVTQLPVLTKGQLMASFDDWVTDRAVTHSDVETFLGDPSLIGERYLGRYAVWKSSGSTGEPGIFIHDAAALTIYDALLTTQLNVPGLAARYVTGLVAKGGRAALVVATGGHFASIASWRRLCRNSPWLRARAFSVMTPLRELVAELNAYQPAFLASYPTVLALLAEEQDCGRLRIAPASVWAGGECLAPATHATVERVFGCPIANEYGTSECLSIAYGCRHGWLHVNADWVMLEPVDRDYRPTPPGEASHTVLLTNLANRVQPVIRYDLGDSITVKPEPCPCGNPLMAIRVEGRHDDIVSLRAPDGSTIHLPPLALTTIVEEASGVHRFQIIQTGADRMALRLDPPHSADRQAAWLAASAALREYLATQALPNVQITLDEEAPAPDPVSGKLREVVAERAPKLPA